MNNGRAIERSNMSDIHTMLGSDNGETLNLIFHYTVPNVNNDVGNNYRTIVKDYIADHTSAVPLLPGAEQTDLDNGLLFEWPASMSSEREKGLGQLQTRARTLYTELEPEVTGALKHRFRYTATTIDII